MRAMEPDSTRAVAHSFVDASPASALIASVATCDADEARRGKRAVWPPAATMLLWPGTAGKVSTSQAMNQAAR